MPILDEIGALLQTAGLGTLGSTLFLGIMPTDTTPPNSICISLYENGGFSPQHMLGGGGPGSAKLQKPGLQVIVRSAPQGYAAGRTKIGAVRQALDGLTNQTLSGTRYLSIFAENEPHLIERDANQRVLFGCDFNVVKEPS
jgi:minor capsid protein